MDLEQVKFERGELGSIIYLVDRDKDRADIFSERCGKSFLIGEVDEISNPNPILTVRNLGVTGVEFIARSIAQLKGQLGMNDPCPGCGDG